ncbi:peptidoglycan-binding domain-containing protein [Arcanobacterium phocae]|uniref:peptidoglycan-binding domain-containing protein n=1 Tax=Arcanobacterium phocae TaxID=131112 RepID=UPI001C11019B|nr:peptidoglycan-binding domain-containing protein [Arcanobacterium phocae]
MTKRPKKVMVVSLFLLLTTITVLSILWALRVTFATQAVSNPTSETHITVDVLEQTVGQSLTVTTTASRDPLPLSANTLTGTATYVTDKTSATQGDNLYTVNDQPVWAIVSSTPIWRDLSEGLRGDDVVALRNFLADLGYIDIREGQTFTSGLAWGVKAFQKDHGLEETGQFPHGTLIAIPHNDTPIKIDNKILFTGAQLNGGEAFLSTYSQTPTFIMMLGQGQAEMIPTGAVVQVYSGQTMWEGIAGSGTTTPDGVSIPVTAPDGSILCGDSCSELPPGELLHLNTHVVLVPEQTGPTVPVSAILTTADGQTQVRVIDGKESHLAPVTVRALASGLAVVDGIEVGTQVEAIAEQSRE